MGKINGLEDEDRVPPKVRRMYRAVLEMLEEGTDASAIRVSMITERAGIGKGTAYEYFDSREEIVCCAIVFQVRSIFGWLEKALEELGSFEGQLKFLLDEIEKGEVHKTCFLRIVHLVTDTSDFNRMIQTKMSAEAFGQYRPANVIGRVLGHGVDRGELRGDLPLDYMVYCLAAHLLTYMTMLAAGDCQDMDLPALRALVYQGIMGELARKNPDL